MKSAYYVPNDTATYRLLFLMLSVTVTILLFFNHPVFARDTPSKRTFKILHIMSYHMPWKWTEDQLAGFKAALQDVKTEYKIFQLDTKRNDSDEWKEKVSRHARQLIEIWKPDLVYANDDNAQKYVVKHYVNTDVPFVFSGVNADPREYGFTGSINVTGVLEQEHFLESLALLKAIVPTVKKIAVIFDDGATWPAVIQRMKQHLSQINDVEIAYWDKIETFAEYKRRIKFYQGKVDAIALLGIFTYKDAQQHNVPYTDVLKWTAENSPLPDFSFWKDRITYGTLCTVTVSGYEQGLSAGKIARSILVDKTSPAVIPMVPTVKGKAVISLARARKLGISINTSILLTAEVVETFSWEH